MEEVDGEFWQSQDDGGIGFSHCGVFVQEVANSSNGQLIGYCSECHFHVLVSRPTQILISEAINAEIERFLKISPAAEKDRQTMFDDLLAVYNARGVIAKLTFNINFDDGLDNSIIGSLP